MNGFEAAAPCKGKGISAQGKVNRVNDTLGPPMTRVLKGIAPCKGRNVEDRGNAPSTQTGRLSENGMHWWNDEHMGIMHLCNAPNLRPLDTNGRIVGKWHALVER